MSDDDRPLYEPGDVVFGADPFRARTGGRPWLVIANHEGQQFHGEQYIAVTITTSMWMEGLIRIDEDDWVFGGAPAPSRVVPWAVQSIAAADIARWQGRLSQNLLDTVIDAFQEYLRYE